MKQIVIKRAAFIIACTLIGITLYKLASNKCLHAQASSVIPVEVLFDNIHQKLSPHISPNGKFLAYLAPVNGITTLWVRSIDKNDDRPVFSKSIAIQTFFWAFDNEHIFYIKDASGDENWQLYKVSLNDGIGKPLTALKRAQIRVIKYSKYHPDRILIGINERDPKYHDVYKLNLKTGSLTLVIENRDSILSWQADEQLNIKSFIKVLPDGNFELFARKTDKMPWRSVATFTDEEDTPNILGFTHDGKGIYLLDGRAQKTKRFVLLSLEDNTTTTLFADDEYDIASDTKVIFHPTTYIPEALNYVRERGVWKAFDADMEKDLNIMESLDSGDMLFLNRSEDDRYWVVGFIKDTSSSAYWLFDRSTQQGTFLFKSRSQLDNYNLSSMRPISFTSRDGLTIHGYLTCPAGKECKNLPLVLLVHGGPRMRDYWGYNSEVQFLASRGYAVLQINYRGSLGYGKDFLNAGNKEWGRKMQNDLIDGAQWAINEGIADPKRLAIFGGSYGGYAALVGAAFTPDFFRCAVDIVGMSNLITFLQSIPPYWESYRTVMYKRIGNLETEEEMLKERSPLFSADKIKIPVLIAQGANDPRVKQAESEQIVAALKKNNIPHEYLLFKDEGHGFVQPENNIKFYKTAEEFLARYL